jgi:uncharacterized protein (DUF1778 family)
MAAARTGRSRSERIEIRASPAERALIDEAVAATGTDLTTFVLTNLSIAARQVLADRTAFTLDTHGAGAWEAINAQPPRDLAGLRALIERPSPFADL